MSQRSIPHGRHSITNHIKKLPLASITILAVIIILLVSVCTTTFLFLLPRENHTVQDKIYHEISNLSKDYYENYLYKQLLSTKESSSPTVFETNMQKYREYGFSVVRLRQILVYNQQKGSSYSASLTNYCDENRTYIKYFPEPPFKRSSYRTEFTYSCNF